MNCYARFVFLLAACGTVHAADLHESKTLDDYNVVWTTPSKDSSGSMPLGNGDIGLNVWAEPDGDLLFYIGKTDAYSGIGRLLKLGRIRLKLDPNPFENSLPFKQTLFLRKGCAEFTVGKKDEEVIIKLWVDANRPMIHLVLHGKKPVSMEVKYETWREKPRIITEKKEKFSARGIIGGDIPMLVEADTIVDDKSDSVVFYHRNNTSVWKPTLEHQGLGSLAKAENDPLLHRTFGGLIKGPGLKKTDIKTLHSSKPDKEHNLSITVLTAITETADQWLDDIEALSSQCENTSLKKAFAEHEKWWQGFWDRSYIFISPSTTMKDGRDEPFAITRGYILQRFISACSGRGKLPIKFNGSIFTVDANEKDEKFDADYRRWGGCYWFQNTRLSYWPMLESGDFDMMRPLFDMYIKALPLAKQFTKKYYNHGGAYFPETMYFWGTPTNHDYSSRRPNWQRGDAADGDILNPYIKRYWVGGLELSTMGMDLYGYQQDRKFLEDIVLPLASAIVEFYDQHYPRDESGTILFDPAQSLETWHIVRNPLPEIAGLKYLLERLLKLPADSTTEKQRDQWQRMLAELPDLPMKTVDGKTYMLPAEKYSERANRENPELYAVFPYRLYCIGKQDVNIGIETFNRRHEKRTGCWHQDAIQAAYLGLTDAAKNDMTKNFSTKHAGSRFPAFWGPNYDWIPDQDHGGVAMKTLQAMLLQPQDDKKIALLPAWPKDWNVEFKLHAPKNSTVECVYRDGEIKSLKVVPEERKKDIVLNNQGDSL